jgi:inner membrane protein
VTLRPWATAPAGLPRWQVRPAPFALVALVLVLDLLAGLRAWPVPVLGLLDEPAHLATAWLGLAALAPVDAPRRFWLSALIASVAIDVDHVPLYLTGGAFAVDGGRPPTHCLLTVVLLATCALAWRGRAGWLWGAAAGVLLHFTRDLATRPGVPLLWPADGRVLLSYTAYVLVLLILSVLAFLRRRPPDPRRDRSSAKL